MVWSQAIWDSFSAGCEALDSAWTSVGFPGRMKGWDHWGPPCPASPGRNALPLLLSWLSLLECLLALFLPLAIDLSAVPYRALGRQRCLGDWLTTGCPRPGLEHLPLSLV